MAVDWEEKVLIPCAAVFGEDVPATFYPSDDSADGLIASYPVVPIFDEAYREIVLLDAMAPTTDAMPVVGINAAQFKSPPLQDARLYIPRTATTYLVKEVREDGHGNFKLMLTHTDPEP